MVELPLEIWQHIGFHSDEHSVRALRQTCQTFYNLLSEKIYEKLCRKQGVRLLPSHIEQVIASHPSLRVDYLSLFHNNPFADDIGRLGIVGHSLLTPLWLPCHTDARGRLHLTPVAMLAPPSECAQQEARGRLYYKLDLTEIGVPGWAIDVFRPRLALTVRGYRMPQSDGDILVSASLLRSDVQGGKAECRKEHQGWFMAGWHASQKAVEESVNMDFEVYGEGARVLSIVASCSGGGRLGGIEVSVHFSDVVPVDVHEQLTQWEQRRCSESLPPLDIHHPPTIQISECQTIIGVERNELVLRSTATLSMSRLGSAAAAASIISID